MTYEQAMEYMDQAAKKGSVLGLGPMTELLKRLDHPEDRLKIIHVAGTNGKGSTCAYLASILANAGYQIGRYNSPAVFEIHENINVTRKNSEIQTTIITKSEYAKAVTKVRECSDAMAADGENLPTVFELETAAALLYFVEQKCDFVLLEVGMGGRLDATNAIRNKLCSVLASISRDHWQFLGDTLGEIAYEKAGIISEHGVAITTGQPAEAMDVIEKVSREKKAKLIISDYTKATQIQHSLEGVSFEYPLFQEKQDRQNKQEAQMRGAAITKQQAAWKVRLLGVHQVQNAALAIDTVGVLKQMDVQIPEQAIRQGLLDAVWHGRLEQIGQQPYFFIDGAHNEGAAQVLADSIPIYFAGRRIIYIVGIFRDKDYRSVLHKLLPFSHEVIAIEPKNPRALPVEQLVEAIHAEYRTEEIADCKESEKQAQTMNKQVYSATDVAAAIQKAKELANKEDVILAFGSLSFLNEILIEYKKTL